MSDALSNLDADMAELERLIAAGDPASLDAARKKTQELARRERALVADMAHRLGLDLDPEAK